MRLAERPPQSLFAVGNEDDADVQRQRNFAPSPLSATLGCPVLPLLWVSKSHDNAAAEAPKAAEPRPGHELMLAEVLPNHETVADEPIVDEPISHEPRSAMPR